MSDMLARSEWLYKFVVDLNARHEGKHFVVNVVPDPPVANFATIVSRKLQQSRLSARPFYDGVFPAVLVMKENASNSFHIRFTSLVDAGDVSFLPFLDNENLVCLSVLV